ncbi:hypothetical protein AAKU55_005836 [Oxalobacteraceae bacterium GrIS 1.11]
MVALRSEYIRTLCRIGAASLALAYSATSLAEEKSADEASKLQWNGFLSVIGGKILSSENVGPLNTSKFNCPCYVGDYANGGVYEGSMPFCMELDAHCDIG